jgi:hypothetical protein
MKPARDKVCRCKPQRASPKLSLLAAKQDHHSPLTRTQLATVLYRHSKLGCPACFETSGSIQFRTSASPTSSAILPPLGPSDESHNARCDRQEPRTRPISNFDLRRYLRRGWVRCTPSSLIGYRHEAPRTCLSTQSSVCLGGVILRWFMAGVPAGLGVHRCVGCCSCLSSRVEVDEWESIFEILVPIVQSLVLKIVKTTVRPLADTQSANNSRPCKLCRYSDGTLYDCDIFFHR